jgi:hypothetical protein
MSEQLISRSADLRRLRDEGYNVSVVAGYLVVRDVPYVDSSKAIRRGALVSTLTLEGETTAKPDTHVVTFAGEMPCDEHGTPLSRILNSSGEQTLVADRLVIQHTFSSKPAEGYLDYHDKMTTYVAILAGPAAAIAPEATATTFFVVEGEDEDSVFEYTDTASSRSGTHAISRKLAVDKIGIVGLGGTGGYVLDLVTKTPVREIHTFDGDRFLQHNAFRSPGAASINDLTGGPRKVDYFAQKYSPMRRGIVPHPYHLDGSNASELAEMDFVFICIDRGEPRRTIVDALETAGVSFIDVGMGIYEIDGSLAGIVRTTTSTPTERAHVHSAQRIPFADGDDHDYEQNIQIADLNALNAALAVIKWKKLMGFYNDLENEMFSVYTIDGNHVLNEDHAS